MKHLEIYNFGPIREAIFDFTRVNVFIGPQSIGKSCVLKIACHCAWVEKRLMVTRDVSVFQEDNYFFKQLLSFHKLQGYDTNKDLRIVYRTSFLTLEYSHALQSFTCKFTSQIKRYKRAKLSYIPAERNVISTIPNWLELSYNDTNVRSFMSDWAEARREFAAKHLPILSLGAEYYYDKKNDVDMVHFSNMQKALPLSNTSSGIQSLVPFYLYVHYLTHSVFDDSSASIAKERDNILLRDRLYKNYVNKIKGSAPLAKIHDLKVNNEFLSFYSEKDKNDFFELYKNYTRYQHSEIFLEEPEENLFPKTQADVVFYLLEKTFAGEKENTMFLATHSPYILYALNNAILANIVRSKMPHDVLGAMECGKAVFKPSDISVWQIKDGIVEPLQNGKSNTIQDKSGLVRKNYFDSVMKEVMSDFNNMLGYRSYE